MANLDSYTRCKHKFLSYNILIGCELYENSLYNSNSEFVNWKNRSTKIKNVISKCDFGVLVESVNELLSNIIPDNYEYRFANKINKYDGTTIFFNSEKYSFVNQFCFLILKNYPQIVLCIMLENNISKKQFAVVGLHLESGYEKEDIRNIQIGITINKIKQIISDEIPIIIAGDFNCNINIDEKGSLNNLVKNGFKQIPLVNGEITYFQFNKGINDYIFVKGDIEYTKSYTGVKYDTKIPAPNHEQGSYHFPLITDITF